MKIYQGSALDVLNTLPSESVDCVVTSPPYYGLRDYGMNGQIGIERTVAEYIESLLAIFDEVKRVLKKDGTCWVNIGDSYSGSGKGGTGKNSWKNGESGKYPKVQTLGSKSLLQVPSRFAIGMTERGWILRNEIIWHKPNAMPASVKDRFTVDFEKVFFFSKSKRYYFEQQYEPSKDPEDDVRRTMKAKDYARNRQGGNMLFNRGNFNENEIRERLLKGRNKRTVWSISTKPYTGAHFAVFPEALVEAPIRAGCRLGGTVLDPFAGSGTTLAVAGKLGRNAIGIEINPEYITLAKKRLSPTPPLRKHPQGRGRRD